MKVVLEAPIGGLGDALLFSTLPQLYAEQGCDVYYAANVRNPEVGELLYRKNPYFISKFSGDITDKYVERIGIVKEKEFFFKARHHSNPISLIERLHGFPGIGQRPKIYYTPTFLREYENAVVIDPFSVSQAFPSEVFQRFVERLLLPPELDRIVLCSKYSGSVFDTNLPWVHYNVRDIYEYIDIIKSARYVVCTESGSQSLAAAVRHHGIFALCTTMMFNSKFYIYPGVNYTVTGKLGDDYIWNDSTGEMVGVR